MTGVGFSIGEGLYTIAGFGTGVSMFLFITGTIMELDKR